MSKTTAAVLAVRAAASTTGWSQWFVVPLSLPCVMRMPVTAIRTLDEYDSMSMRLLPHVCVAVYRCCRA
jgi:hypothetical protein